MTALLLPTDACPRCLTAVPVHPARVGRVPRDQRDRRRVFLPGLQAPVVDRMG